MSIKTKDKKKELSHVEGSFFYDNVISHQFILRKLSLKYPLPVQQDLCGFLFLAD